jgi:hypothetical protein
MLSADPMVFSQSFAATMEKWFPEQYDTGAGVDVEAEPIVAQRLWRLMLNDHGAWVLTGQYQQEWETAAYTASCNKQPGFIYDSRPSHAAPDFSSSSNPCLCGVNAYKLTTFPDSFRWAMSAQDNEDDGIGVVGIVELGGRVVEYERGYRAEHALIMELTLLTRLPLDPALLEELTLRYDCPVRQLSYTDWKEEWEVTYGRDRETETTDRGTQAGAPTSTKQTHGTVSVAGFGTGITTTTNTTNPLAGVSSSYTALYKQLMDSILNDPLNDLIIVDDPFDPIVKPTLRNRLRTLFPFASDWTLLIATAIAAGMLVVYVIKGAL